MSMPNEATRSRETKTLGRYAPKAIGLAIGLGSLVVIGVAGRGEAVGSKGCDNSIVKGEHGFSYTGTVVGGGAITGIGSETCDATGHCVGAGTNTFDGDPSTTTFTGDYTINADCTGSITTTYPDGSVFHSAVVILHGGDEFHFIGTDPGASYLGIEKRR